MRELRRLLTPDKHSSDEMDSPQKPLPITPMVDDVLVITLGVSNECPGMASEQKVGK